MGNRRSCSPQFNDQTVDVQFSWMKQYKIDVAALQRFNPNGIEGPVRDAITAKVKTASEKYMALSFTLCMMLPTWTEYAIGGKNRLDEQNETIHPVTCLCKTKRQTGGMHLGLWVQR